MSEQTVITDWVRDYVAGTTQLTVYAADDVDVVGLVARAISAENNEWHEDGDGFRKGPWFVDDSERPYIYFSHNDIPGEAWTFLSPTNWDTRGTPNAVRAIGASFLTWHAATYPPTPAEPTGLGAVVDVPEFTPCTPGARERFTLTVESSHNQRPWVLEGDVEIRQTWAQLVNRGPVTVLSEGVTS